MHRAPAVTPDVYLPQPATVLRSEPMTAIEKFLEFKLASGRGLGHMPGQFAMVSIPGIGEAPISISSSPTHGESFEMVIRKVGNVSAAIHGLAAGDRVGIRGPYGTHFPVEDGLKGKDVLFICGGIGLVPLRSAIEYVLDHRGDYGQVTILSGTKAPEDRLFLDDAAAWGARKDLVFLETVDRGNKRWAGNVGVVTTLLPKLKIDPARTAAVICGPPIMYKFVIMELAKMKMGYDRIYVSLERHMKCGVGKCGHCQVNGLYVCQEGPVFRYDSLADVREAI